ncbi:hypothetical protein BASA83_011003 [Batrachochytrium salamandrivorans]|nr:hypothetical protein BASA83_011003 [Batrachochytrium salamandrivorans]
MLRTLSTGKVFTTLDLRGAYNLLRIKEGDEPKTSVHYQIWSSLRFKVYLVSCETTVSTCKAEKCHFYQTEIKYLGYIISSNGIRMDPSKISAVQEWPTPRKVRDLQVFLGFTNFYRSLIKDYSNMTCHLTKLFKKDSPFVWGPEQEKSLQALKDAFAHSDFLTHPDETRPFIVEN